MINQNPDDCEHELEVFEVDPDGSPIQRCRCGRVVEHLLVDGEDPTSSVELAILLNELADTEPEELFDTDVTDLLEGPR